MTIGDVLAMVDEIQPNTYDEQVKITWLSELDGRVFNDVILQYKHDDLLLEDEEGNKTIEPTFTAYVDDNQELLIPDTYADVYRHYVFAQIAYSNGETERYTNSMMFFNASYQDYTKWYARTHKSVIHPLKLW